MEINLAQLLVVGTRDYSIVEQPTPPATELDVANFERLIGSELPADYRRFLLSVNGGMVNTNVVNNLEYKVSPLLNNSSAYSGIQELGFVFSLFNGYGKLLGKDHTALTLTAAFESFSGFEAAGYSFIPPHCIPIADVYGSGYLLLVLDGTHKDKVLYYGYDYHDNPEELYENVSLAGNSFKEFIDSLYAV